MASIFFYGTLLHPQIITRVIGNDAIHLTIAPAVLLHYTRHHVKGCDYPAIAPYTATRALLDGTLPEDQRCVRGSVVSGFTPDEVAILDLFEGDEYIRDSVSITPLGEFTPLPASPIPVPTQSSQYLPPLTVYTYVWSDSIFRLTSSIWSFDQFVKDRLWRWLGKQSADNPDYAIVDQRLNKVVDTSAAAINYPLPEFGRSLLDKFCFHKDYINLNHGSYGSLPRSVLDETNHLAMQVEANPDKFFRRTYYPLSQAVRSQLALLVGANTDEIVMVPNATHGINTVLRNFEWRQGDVLVGTTTTYGAVSRTLQYIHDIPPHPTLSILPLTFPTSHAQILDDFRAHLRAIPRRTPRKGGIGDEQNIVAVIDGIVSNPGCVLPWEDMVRICREEDVWSVVDAAHCLGQQVGLDLGKVMPDFWVSNCHKWLFAKRGCAVLYVPKRNQHIIKTSLPTSFGYVSPEDISLPEGQSPLNDGAEVGFVGLFEFNGTLDFVSYLSVKAALEFRESLGGEERINAYCHDLALRGGRRLAQLLQTNVLDDDGELTANMVNVRLPLPVRAGEDVNVVRFRIEDKLLDQWECFAAVFTHDGKWWTRCSAQVWNELADFDHLAKALAAVCAELNRERA